MIAVSFVVPLRGTRWFPGEETVVSLRGILAFLYEETVVSLLETEISLTCPSYTLYYITVEILTLNDSQFFGGVYNPLLLGGSEASLPLRFK